MSFERKRTGMNRSRHNLSRSGRGASGGVRAFTLVEIMVVIVVLAIVAATVLPNLGGTAGTVRLTATTRHLAALMDYCYHAASATSRVHAIVISADGRQYRVVAEVEPEFVRRESGEGGELEADELLVPIRLPGRFSGTLPEGIAVGQVSMFETELSDAGEEQVRILFFPDGTTEFMSLVVTESGGAQRTIELNGLSGTVTISEPEQTEAEES